MSTTINDVYAIYQAILSGSPSVVIDGLQQSGINPGNQTLHRRGASQRYPNVSALLSGSRSASFSSVALNTLLALGSSEGALLRGSYPIGAAETYTALSMIEAKMDPGGHFAAGSVHRINTISSALMRIRSLRAAQSPDGRPTPAVAEIEVQPIGDGTNDPITVSTGQALPAASAASCELGLWCLGPVLIEGTAEKLITGWSLDTGIDSATVTDPGGVFPLMGYDRGSRPVFNMPFRSPVPLSDLGLSGAAISTTVVFYLVKLDPTGSRVSKATEEHIRITVNHGKLRPLAAAGSIGGDVAAGMRLECLDDGTNNIIEVDTTSTYP